MSGANTFAKAKRIVANPASSWLVGKPDKFVPVPTWTVTVFYRRGCQEETLRLQLALRNSLRHPARVLERGSGGFSFLEIHVAGVTTPSISDAGKRRGCGVPTMVLSETRGL